MSPAVGGVAAGGGAPPEEVAMGHRAARVLRPRTALVAFILLATPLAARAILPLLVAMGHKILKDMILNEVKGQLLGSLAGMGCKGARIAGLIATAEATTHARAGGLAGGAMAQPPAGGLAGPGGGLGGLAGGGLMGGPAPRAPGGGAGGMAMQGAARPGGLGVRGGSGMPVVAPGTQPDMAQAMAMMQAQHPGMAKLSPEQMAQVQETMAGLQESADHPLSRLETMEVFDELRDMGILTDAMHEEARECILLAPLGSDQALGQTGAMMKTMLLPQLRQTRERLAALTPEEQDELADGFANAYQEAKPADRKNIQEGLGLGFFPEPVVEKVRTRLGWR